jgi:mRNA-degrading endonuclease RelE of RelBE toxin-antitoxin system
MMSYTLIFSKDLLKNLKKLAKDVHTKHILVKMLNKLETKGPSIGILLDSRLRLHELKNKRPPLRIYYWPIPNTDKILVFLSENKTNQRRQQETIDLLKEVLRNQDLFE